MKTTSKWQLQYPEASEAVKNFPEQMEKMATSIDTAMTSLNNTVNTTANNLKTSVNTSISSVKQRLSLTKLGSSTMAKSGATFTNANLSKYSVLGFGVSVGYLDQSKEEFVITGAVVNGKCVASGSYFVGNVMRTCSIVFTVSGNTITYSSSALAAISSVDSSSRIYEARRVFSVYGIC